MKYPEFKKLCIDLEHYITPFWAVEKILEHEIMTDLVLDPCAGSGVLCEAAREAGYNVQSIDIHDWGYEGTVIRDFLGLKNIDCSDKQGFTVLMNPPFSRTCEFVEKSFTLGARKIVMFQRWAFKESAKRKPFFEKYPIARQYILCERADCWRFDLPVNERGKRYDPGNKNKELTGTPTAHGWFVWERGQGQSAPPTYSLYK